MRVLLVASVCNNLTQRVHAELRHRRHAVAVEVTPAGREAVAAVARHDPELIVAPPC